MECVALEDCMGALWVHEELALEHFVDLVSSNRHFCTVLTTGLALRSGTCLPVLLERSRDVCWGAVVGRKSISLYLLMLLFS